MLSRSPSAARRALPALVLLALLAPLPAASAQATPQLAVEGYLDRGLGSLVLNVTSRGAGATVGVVVTHADPLAGTVVDRTMTLTLAADSVTTVHVKGVRHDRALRATVVPPEDLPRKLPHADLPDAGDVARMRALASADVPALPAEDGWQRPHAAVYRVHGWATDADASWSTAKVLVTRDSVVVLGWTRGTQLVAQVSRDGGHTFSSAVVIGDVGSQVVPWDFGETGDGQVVFVWTNFYGEAGDPVRMARFAPLSGSVVASATIERGNMSFGDDGWAFVPRATGGVLLMSMRYNDADPLKHGVNVWNVTPTGQVQYFAAIRSEEPLRGFHAAEARGLVGVQYETWRQDGSPGRVYVARSGDGGASWTAPAEARDLTRVFHGNATRGRAAMDDAGTLHVALEGIASTGGYRGLYLRCPLASECVARQATDHDGGVFAGLAARGGRVWLMYSDTRGITLTESVDGGATFGARTAMDSYHPYGLYSAGMYRPGIFPDGRPILVARSSDPTAGGSGGPWLTVAPWYDPAPAAERNFTAPVSSRPVAPTGPRFGLEGLSASATAAVGESVRVSATLRNDGGALGTATVELLVNGTLRDQRAVQVGAGVATVVAFDVAFATAGEHAVTVRLAGGAALPETRIVVQPPRVAEFLMDRLVVPDNVTAGAAFDVVVRVSNVGGADGSAIVQLVLDGLARDQRTLPLGAQAATDAKFHVSLDAVGTRNVTVRLAGEAKSLSALVRVDPVERALFRVSDLALPASVHAGGRATLTALLHNLDPQAARADVRVYFNDTLQSSLGYDVAGNATVPISLAFDAPGPGTLRVRLEVDGGQGSGTREMLVLEPEAALSILNVNAPARWAPGEELPIIVRVENKGSLQGTGTVRLHVDGEVVEARNVTVATGASTGVRFTLRPIEARVLRVAASLDGGAPLPEVEVRVEPLAPTPPTMPIVETGEPRLVVAAVDVRVAVGGEATLFVTVLNPRAEPLFARPPTLEGLPPGVAAEASGDAAVEVPAQGSLALFVTLTAAPDAPESRATARVLVAVEGRAEPLAADVGVRVHNETAQLVRADVQGSALLRLRDVSAGAAMGMAAGAGVAAVFVVALNTDAGRYLVGSTLVPLYSRIRKSDVLTHEVRAGIYEHVRAHPGIRYEDLRQAMGLANGSLAFHLQVLQREGFVVGETQWTRRRFYVNGAQRPPREAVSSAEATLRDLLAAEPSLSAGEVARRLGISRQLARYHLLRLQRGGVVRAEGEGVYRLVQR